MQGHKQKVNNREKKKVVNRICTEIKEARPVTNDTRHAIIQDFDRKQKNRADFN
jgi:hypothetical protein